MNGGDHRAIIPALQGLVADLRLRRGQRAEAAELRPGTPLALCSSMAVNVLALQASVAAPGPRPPLQALSGPALTPPPPRPSPPAGAPDVGGGAVGVMRHCVHMCEGMTSCN